MDKTIFAAYVAGAIAVVAAILWPRRAKADTVDNTPEEMIIPSSQVPLAIASQPVARGIRNNNPGNIEYIAINPYRGQVGSDGRYGKYATPIDGMRALLLEIWDSIDRDYDDTIRKLVSQWAPSNENDTAAYINSVARQTGLSADKTLSYRSNAIEIAKAITRQENGYNPYSELQWREAYQQAGKYL